MKKDPRGFASMNLNKRREIASKGGKAAHEKGTAHEWSREEAREAGRKGGKAAHARLKTMPSVPTTAPKAEDNTPRTPRSSRSAGRKSLT